MSAMLIEIAEEICRDLRTLCIDRSSREFEKEILFSFAWIESFKYIDPQPCLESYRCLETLLSMVLEVWDLALRGEYVVDIDRETARKTVEKLLKLRTRTN